MVLRKIGGSLKAHLTTSFDELNIMEQHGNVSCVELAKEMRQHLHNSEQYWYSQCIVTARCAFFGLSLLTSYVAM